MHAFVLALAAAALLAMPTQAVSQSVEFGPGGVRINPDQERRYEGRSATRSECRALRRACIREEELGVPHGRDCREYRDACR